MRRKKAYLFAGLILLVAILWIGLSTYHYKYQVTVNANIYEVSQQILKHDKWQNWYPGSTRNYTITVLNAVQVKLHTSGKTREDYLSAIPSTDGKHTVVLWTAAITGFEVVRQKIGSSKNIIQPALNNLKQLLENDEKKYGYLIKIISVTDTVILTKKDTAVPGSTSATAKNLLQQLQQKITSDKLTAETNYFYISYTTNAGGQPEVAVGIPVYKMGSDRDGFEFLKLPAQGRLLSGFYTGDYAGLKKLYRAMDEYVRDKKLKKVAQPLEKHSSINAISNTETETQFQLLYPIY